MHESEREHAPEIQPAENTPKEPVIEKLPAIEKAQTFEELFAALEEIGGLWDTRHTKFYSPAKLKENIEAVRQTRSLFVLKKLVTRNGGLQDKVRELIEKEGGFH